MEFLTCLFAIANFMFSWHLLIPLRLLLRLAQNAAAQGR